MSEKYKGHTPGPWVALSNDREVVIQAKSAVPGDIVAVVEIDGRTDGVEDWANATLIADAPTLHADNARLRAALADMLAWIEGNDSKGLTRHAIITRVRRALEAAAIERDAGKE